MLLTIDIGNTNIKFGVYDGEVLVSKLAMPTVRDLSVEALTRVIGGRITQPITAAIVSSVVPEVDAAIHGFIAAAFNVEALFVKNNDDLGLTIKYEPLEDAGADRLVNTFSAVEKYGAPAIVCSFGTALTVDYVNKYRVLIGGLIAPGMNTLATALKITTSKLPEVTIEKPESIVQTTTVGSIRSGIVYGYFGLVEELLNRVKKEMGDAPKVIATGGFAKLIAENTTQIDVVDENLLLDGLQRLHVRLTAT
ncbi:MAG: type III pantothenate kinase [Pyrinomonadaceae bacterium]|nr:type III pantothenate kinase [Pyrinomonadaceae bacterium]MBP6212385.1 type III pantothenate kinase [Pyrinomonadaceae bacterium]